MQAWLVVRTCCTRTDTWQRYECAFDINCCTERGLLDSEQKMHPQADPSQPSTVVPHGCGDTDEQREVHIATKRCTSGGLHCDYVTSLIAVEGEQTALVGARSRPWCVMLTSATPFTRCSQPPRQQLAHSHPHTRPCNEWVSASSCVRADSGWLSDSGPLLCRSMSCFAAILTCSTKVPTKRCEH